MEIEQFKDLLLDIFMTMVVVTLVFAMVSVALVTLGLFFYPTAHYITTGYWSYVWMVPCAVVTGTLAIYDFKLIVYIIEKYLQKEKG